MNQVEVLETPIKSEGDKKEYRLIKLENGLKALLVRKKKDENNSNDSEDSAAANLTISVGSFDDPPSAMGLAHFLEHMVHMGSRKYPEESSYNDFLTVNGGRRNAMTASEFTTYFFNVAEEVFPEALGRLEQLIEAPLLMQNSMQREREAVDSEYEMINSSNAVRIQSIVKSLIHDFHPASKFNVGNLKTLRDNISDEELHKELLKLHDKYVANKMYLAVQSSKTLDELQSLVVEQFSNIKSGNEEVNSVIVARDNPEDYFKPEFFNSVHYVMSKTSKNSILLAWPLPSIIEHYKVAPLDYISNIFGNEGEGGISTYLRENHWVTKVDLYTDDTNLISKSSINLVRISLDLTESGIENISKILEAVFSYLLMIKETPIEEHRRLYNELKEKSENSFKFHTESEPIDNVLDNATNMLVYDDADILRGKSIYQRFDAEIISDVIERLNQRKFGTIILTSKHESYPYREKYHNTEYDRIAFPDEYQKLWDERKVKPNFFLEKSNPYKTTNFDIFENDDESPIFPLKIFEDGIFEVWHRLDNKFKLPTIQLKMKLISPIFLSSTENLSMLKIFTKTFEFYLKAEFFDAKSANYIVDTSIDRNGMKFSFTGHSQHMIKFYDNVTKFLKNFLEMADQETLDAIKENLKQSLSEKLMTNYILNNEFTGKVLLEHYHSDFDIIDQVDKVTLENLRNFKSKFLSHLNIQILAQGNITKDQALQIVNLAKTNIKCDVVSEEYERKQRCYQLPQGNNVLRLKSLMLNDDNSAIKNFYQIGPDTIRTRCMTRLAAMILNPKAYDYLRSKEQLAYGVACFFREKGGIVALAVLILSQEGKHSYSKVCSKLDTFINEVCRETIDQMTDEEFERYKDSRVKQLTADDLDLDSEVDRNWKEVVNQEYIFDKFQIAAKETKNISKTDFQEFFKSFTDPDKMRRLSVQVIGNHKSEEVTTGNNKSRKLEVEFINEKLSDDESLITNVEDFQKDLYLYPVSKFQIK
ncbi:CLUMA_CG002224, isoform A [Clunio marinus]|uniref:CLUMA_CG002224, isoform A n=1 Tax=Clunio marinus TaxID=568069 RepID=A0A1J1HKH3_9DIPT|nr:CLUMA_CG002224, isoform A [Clunio marinus]